MITLEDHNLIQKGSAWYQTAKIPSEMLSYLWEIIEKGKKENVDARGRLVGNISRSIEIQDHFNLICAKVIPAFYKENELNFNLAIEEAYSRFCANEYTVGFQIPTQQLWANFHKKHEFNPIHRHTGSLSFVIWMNIPYCWEDEKEAEFVKHSANQDSVGNFFFYYHEGRHIKSDCIKMSPEVNGTMALFPSWMSHCVYPFYTSDKERISISGNVIFQQIA